MKAKDIKLKVLQGTLRSNHRMPTKAKAEKPEVAWPTVVQLEPEEKKIFERIRKYMQEKKLWRSPFSEHLAQYVRVTHMLSEAMDNLGNKGTIQTFSNKTRNVSPEFTVYTRLLEKQTELAGIFGFTPKSWKALDVPTGQLDLFPEEKEQDSPMRKRG
jgi:phage terminase small subunit